MASSHDSHSSSSSSSFFSIPAFPKPPSPILSTQRPVLHEAPLHQAAYMPSPGLVSLKASIVGTEPATPKQPQASVKRKPAPRKEIVESKAQGQRSKDGGSDIAADENRPAEHPQWCATQATEPPPPPLSPNFPEYVYESLGLPLPPTRPAFPPDVVEPTQRGQFKISPPTTNPPSISQRVRARPDDPYHRPIHDAYPHVFRPKAVPPPKPKLKRNESSRLFGAAENALNGFVKSAKGFLSHRSQKGGNKSGVGMSIPVVGSFQDFHPKMYQEKNVLHSDVKAIPIRDAQTKLTGRPDPSTGGMKPSKPRAAKFAGDYDRMTRWTDFMASDLFDESDLEESEEMPPSKQPLRNRGSSKALPPLPPEALLTQAEHAATTWDPDNDCLPSPQDSLHDNDVTKRPATKRIRRRITTGKKKHLQPHPRPDKRVDTSRYSWIPDVNTQIGDEYDIEKIRAKCTYEVPDSDEDEPSTALKARVVKPLVWWKKQGPQPPMPQPPGLEINLRTPVDWEEIHRGESPSNRRVLLNRQSGFEVEMPRFDNETPTMDDLFDDITREELDRALGKTHDYLWDKDVRPRDSAAILSQYYDEADAAVDDLFDNIDDAVQKTDNPELYDMNDQLERERRSSDGSIVIDTFPHDSHTSWRATERPDDLTVHRDHHRITRDFHGTGGGQDDAGLLMERLQKLRGV